MKDTKIGNLPSERDDRIEFFIDLLKTHGCLFKYIPEQHNNESIPKLTNEELSTLYDQVQSIIDIGNKHRNQPNTNSNKSTNVAFDNPEKSSEPLCRSTRTRRPVHTTPQYFHSCYF